MRNIRLNQEVNFVVSVVCMGSAALLGIVLMLQAAEMENPLVESAIAFAAERAL